MCVVVDVTITSRTPFSCPASADVDGCIQCGEQTFLSSLRLHCFDTRQAYVRDTTVVDVGAGGTTVVHARNATSGGEHVSRRSPCAPKCSAPFEQDGRPQSRGGMIATSCIAVPHLTPWYFSAVSA